MENLTVNFQLPAAAVFVPLMLDDGHGDYNRSYEWFLYCQLNLFPAL